MDARNETIDIVLGEEFLTWLWFRSDTAPEPFKCSDGNFFNVNMEQKIVVESGAGEQKETAIVSGALSSLNEARFGLGMGKKVSRALVRLEKNEMVFQFTLRASDFSFSGLKTPKIERADKDDDPDALFLEKIFLMETCLEMLDVLYAMFIELRLSDEWTSEVEKMSLWCSKT